MTELFISSCICFFIKELTFSDFSAWLSSLSFALIIYKLYIFEDFLSPFFKLCIEPPNKPVS